jgi:hypothetical protein
MRVGQVNTQQADADNACQQRVKQRRPAYESAW